MTGFSTSVSALKSLRQALEVTSHNIANAANPDYSRQSVELSTQDPRQLGTHLIGTGVKIDSIRRHVDTFVSKSYRDALTQGSQAEFSHDVAKIVDNYIGQLDTGIGKALEEYYQALQDVSVNPSYETKGVLLARSQALAQRVHDFDSFVQNRYTDLYFEQQQTVTRINELTTTIAQLNQQIEDLSSRSSSALPNDLLDKRDAHVHELSTFVNLNVIEDNHKLNISIGGTVPLVVGSHSEQLAVVPNAFEPHKGDIMLKGVYFDLDVTNQISAGRLGASLHLRENLLDEIGHRMGRMIATLTLATNEVYEKGMNELKEVGQKFFTDLNKSSSVQERAIPNDQNLGHARFNVQFSPLYLEEFSQSSLIGDPSALEDSNQLPTSSQLSTLRISNTPIAMPLASDDLQSNTGAHCSAIALSAAINRSASSTGVHASAGENIVFLGQFNPSATASWTLCGQNIDLSLYANVWQLAEKINQDVPGITAHVQSHGSLSLIAADGRNIDLQSDGNDAISAFEHFDTTLVNQVVQRAALKLDGSGDFTLSDNFALVGLEAKTYPSQSMPLQATSYELSYNGGNYSLVRNSDHSRVYHGSDSTIAVDGLIISLDSGQMHSGDSFLINPYENVARKFQVVPQSAKECALALPFTATAHTNNHGQGHVEIFSVNNNIEPLGDYQYLSGYQTGSLTPPLKIEFLSSNTYQITDGSTNQPIGPVQTYAGQKDIVLPIEAVGNQKIVSQYRNQTFRPGYKIQLSGPIEAGDSFEIVFNTDGKLDSRTALSMANLQKTKIIDSKSATCEQEFTQIAAFVGTYSAQQRSSSESYDKLVQTISEKRMAVSGVNLDEEAANIMMLQQAYQAAAQMISIQRTLFETMISMVRS